MMRELNTDRPDKTESPYTVDAGHFQIEADLVTYTRDRDQASGVKSESTSFLLSNLKVGLTNSVDLQLVVSPQERQRSPSAARLRRTTASATRSCA
jgi:hypothetical protein